MDERLLEIREYQGEGYKALIDYGDWRVALLRPSKDATPADITRVERHRFNRRSFCAPERIWSVIYRRGVEPS